MIGRRSRVRRFARSLIVAAVAAALIGSVLGLLLRDRVALLAALTYAPIPHIALVGIVVDALLRGRAWRGPRFGLSAACVVIAAWHAWGLIGWRTATPAPDGATTLRVMQWNVRWGGTPYRVTEAWTKTVVAIAGESPDLVILSEAPPVTSLPVLLDRMGRPWSAAHHEQPPAAAYWYRLVVAAPHPVTFVAAHELADGVGAEFEVAMPERTLRVLVVDGPSAPWRDRRPMLAAVLRFMHDAEAAGRPIDLLAGDFNAPSRSVGFDGFANAGFTSAAGCVSWRGTWRMPLLPWLDLDQIWVRNGFADVASTHHVTGPLRLDHRGIVTDLALRP